MQKLIETLKTFGIEVPEDKQSEVKKTLSDHYKNVAEYNKAISKLETDRDTWKKKAETAEDTLKGFEGVDLETMNKDLAEWKKKAEDAEKNAQAQLYERDFADALKTELESVKFSSDAAKRAIMEEVKDAGLKLKDGRILGLNDLLAQMKEKDASAFVDESEEKAKQNAAKFTTAFKGSGTGGAMTKADFKALSLDERIKLKQEQPDLYESLK